MTHHKNHLSPLEYLERLIEEWFVADFRRRVYHKRSDRNYWKKVCDGKKRKIEDISYRNNIPHIFNSKKVREKYYDKYYPVEKLPLVIRTDEDLRYYFSKDNDAMVYTDGTIRYGNIEQVDHDNEEIAIRHIDDNKLVTYPFNIVRRIV